MRRWAVVVGVGMLAAACRDQEQPVIVRNVTMHVPQSCALDRAAAYGILYASGDFEPPLDPPPIESLYLREEGRALSNLPAHTRALVADVTDPQGTDTWRGYVETDTDQGPIDVLLWRTGGACTLSDDLGARVDPAFGAFDGKHLLVAGGKPPQQQNVPDSFVVDLTTGRATRLKGGLLTPRQGATITPFGKGGALVAGGRAIDTDLPLNPATAEVFVASGGADVGDFDGKPIALSLPRADHGAVVMGSGETLLVGGVGGEGKALRSLEIVRPGSPRGLTAGLAQLELARIKPTVLRLASGELMVAGGTLDNGQPADRIEFFAPDARAVSRKSEPYRPGRETAFIELPAGGALMVNAGEVASDVNTVYVISADGVLEPTPSNLPGSAERLRLFQGPAGAPVLWNGSRWLAWQPWNGVFGPLVGALTAPGPGSKAITSPDSGLALWLSDDGTHVLGFRFQDFQFRGPYSAVPHPMLVEGVVGLSPDRMIDLRVNDTQRIRFNKSSGLTLEAGASAFVVDATFASFTLDAEIPTGIPPLVVLREASGVELEIGGPNCRIEVPVGTAKGIHVERDGAIVRVAVDDRPAVECTQRVPSDARLGIGVRGVAGASRSSVKSLQIVRR